MNQPEFKRMRRSGDILLWSFVVVAALCVLALIGLMIASGSAGGDIGQLSQIPLVLLVGVYMPLCVGFKSFEGRSRRPGLGIVAVAAGLVTCATTIALLLLIPYVASNADLAVALALLSVIGVSMSATSLATMVLTAPRLRMEAVIRVIRVVAATLIVTASMALAASGILGVAFAESPQVESLSELALQVAMLALCAALLLALASVALLRVAQPSLSGSGAARIPTSFRCPSCVVDRSSGAPPAPGLRRTLHDASRCPSCGVATRIEVEGFRCACGMNMAGIPGDRCVACAEPLARPWHGPALASREPRRAPRAGDRVHAWLALAVGVIATVLLLGPVAADLTPDGIAASFTGGFRSSTTMALSATGSVAMLWAASLVAASAWRRGWHVPAALVQGAVLVHLVCAVWAARGGSDAAFHALAFETSVFAAVGIYGGSALALVRIRLRWLFSRVIRAAAVLGICLTGIAAADLHHVDGLVTWLVPFDDVTPFLTFTLLLVAIVVVLRRLERRQELRRRGDPVRRGSVTLPCPRCGVKTHLSTESGGGRCEGCRLEFSVSSWHAHCRCGYDLAGVRSPNCPECGHAVMPLARLIPAEPAAEIATNGHQ